MTIEVLRGKTVILGITGSIAAYKAAEICSLLVRGGATVHVVMTENATRFVGPVTFRGLTGSQVITGLWDEPREYEIAHVSLPDKADVVLIAPATANIIGKIASGIADDMLTTMIMATKAPVVIAPAMNYKMWENPIVRANVERLKSQGYHFVGPETGRLACGVEAVGRLASPEAIIQAVVECMRRSQDLEGVRILVTAGPTESRLILCDSSATDHQAKWDTPLHRQLPIVAQRLPLSQARQCSRLQRRWKWFTLEQLQRCLRRF